jgi:aspartate/methionine/tyrosine aminotransferase
MSDYPLGRFLSRWYPTTRHELAASESETWRLEDLLALAAPEDLARWEGMGFGYTDPCGSARLRATIARMYEAIRPEEVIAFAGAQEALSVVLRTLLGPEDHAVVVVPCYQPSELAVTELCAATGVALDAARGWALDVAQIQAAILPNTRLVLVNLPNNPTGKLVSPAVFAELVALCRHHGLWLVNDEVYRLIDRDPSQRLPCVADVYERGISIDAVSKSHGLPGLRVGWMACRDEGLRARVATRKQTASLCLAGPSENLAEIALAASARLLARNRRIAEENLACVEAFLAEQPGLFSWHRPEGGVVGYVRYHGADGVEWFAARMARERGVLVLPASVWRSALAPLPEDRFRLGFGRLGSADCLVALSERVEA